MKSVSGKRFCQVLDSKGWELQRVKGSHHIYARYGSVVRVSVPVHGNKSLSTGLQRHLMKQADIDEADL